MVLIIVIIWIVFLSDFKFRIETKNNIYLIRYNGIVWVGLNYYTIVKYDSKDKPMKWFEFKKSKNNF